MEILKNILIGYLTLYFVIWLHEVGHAFCYWKYGTKKNPLLVSVKPYIFFSTPLPIDLEKEKLMSEKQKFNTSMAGIIVNLTFAFISMFIILLIGVKDNLVFLFLFYFATLHFSEAISYLTISNIFLASDMKSIAKYNSKLRIPCFLIGCLGLVCLVYLISMSLYSWRIYLIIFNMIAMLCMGIGRIIFTYFYTIKK
ncbi:hypothetical protein [Clostridium sp.]|uniref:hypothetical protein n=1 Tax=Clostridium sp. TaxID=1506 RepID=UPI00321628B0